MRSGANAVAGIDDAVAVDGAGDNDAARVAVVMDRLQLTIAMEGALCIAPGDTGSSHVRSTARNFLGSLRELCDVQQMG